MSTVLSGFADVCSWHLNTEGWPCKLSVDCWVSGTMVTGYLRSYQEGSQEQLRDAYSASAFVSTVMVSQQQPEFPKPPRVVSLSGKSPCHFLRIKVLRASLSIDFWASFRMLDYSVCVHSWAIEYVGDCAQNMHGSQRQPLMLFLRHLPFIYIFIYLRQALLFAWKFSTLSRILGQGASRDLSFFALFTTPPPHYQPYVSTVG